MAVIKHEREISLLATSPRLTSATGYNAVTLALVAPASVVTANSSGVVTAFPTGNFLRLYQGGSLLTTGVTYGPASTTKNGLTLAVNTSTGAITLSQTSWTSAQESFTLTATYNSVTYEVIYSIAKATAGAAGAAGGSPTAYWLVLSTAAFQKSQAGVFTPINVVATAMQAVGAATPTTFAGRFKAYENGTLVYTSASNESTITRTPSSGSVTSIKIEMFLTDGTTKVDEQTVPVAVDGAPGADGNDGTSPMLGVLSNEACVVPTAADGSGGVYTATPTVLTVYEGATKLTYVSSAPAAGQYTVSAVGTSVTVGTVSVVSGNASYAAASALTADVGRITYTITGKRLNGTDFTSFTRVQSISRAKQGVIGTTGGTGPTGQSNHRVYLAVAVGSTPATPAATTNGATPTSPVTWSATPVTLSTGQVQFQSDGTTPAGSTTTTWGTPYPSYLKAATLESIVSSTGDLSVTGSLIMGSGAYMRSTTYTPGSTGWQINADGTAEFSATSIRGALTASNLAIGDYSNLVPDAEMVDPDQWLGSGVTKINSVGTGFTSTNYLRLTGAAGAYSAFPISNYIPVEAGAAYLLSVQGMLVDGTGGLVRTNLFWYDDIGVNQSSTNFNTISNSTTLTRINVRVVAPAGKRYVRVRFYKDLTGTTTEAYVGGVSLRKINTTDLIEDGAVTAGKITVDNLSVLGNANTGNLTVNGRLHNTTGYLTGVDFTSYSWPVGTSKSGFYLGPNGLRIGSLNDGRYVDININGNISMPGFQVVNGVATFGGITVSGGVISGIGTSGVPVDNRYNSTGLNLIPNSDQASAVSMTAYLYPGVTSTTGLMAADAYWTPPSEYILQGTTTRNLFIYQTNNLGTGDTAAAADISVLGTSTDTIPVVEGERFCFSVYLQAHRCNGQLRAVFYNSTGGEVLTHSVVGTLIGGSTTCKSLAEFHRISLVQVVPAGAITVRLIVRKYNTQTGEANSFIWVAAPQFEIINELTTGPSPYRPGPSISVAQLGYEGDLNATYGAPGTSPVGSITADTVATASIQVTDGGITVRNASGVIVLEAGGTGGRVVPWIENAEAVGGGIELVDSTVSATNTVELRSLLPGKGIGLNVEASGGIKIATVGSLETTAQAGIDVPTTSTTAAAVSGLSIPMAANTTYIVEGYLIVTTAATTTGVIVGCTTPTNARTVITATAHTAVAAAEVRSIYMATGGTASMTFSAQYAATPGTTQEIIKLEGIVVNGSTAGNFVVNVGSEVSASNVTVKAGSTLALRDVTPGTVTVVNLAGSPAYTTPRTSNVFKIVEPATASAYVNLLPDGTWATGGINLTTTTGNWANPLNSTAGVQWQVKFVPTSGTLSSNSAVDWTSLSLTQGVSVQAFSPGASDTAVSKTCTFQVQMKRVSDGSTSTTATITLTATAESSSLA